MNKQETKLALKVFIGIAAFGILGIVAGYVAVALIDSEDTVRKILEKSTRYSHSVSSDRLVSG